MWCRKARCLETQRNLTGQGGQAVGNTGVSPKSDMQCPKTYRKTNRPGWPGRQKYRSVVQKQNAMFKNTSQSCPVRAASAPEVTECCAKAKLNVQKHTTKLTGQGGQGARSTGVLCKNKTQCSKTHHKVDRQGRSGRQKYRNVVQKQNTMFKNTPQS